MLCWYSCRRCVTLLFAAPSDLLTFHNLSHSPCCALLLPCLAPPLHCRVTVLCVTCNSNTQASSAQKQLYQRAVAVQQSHCRTRAARWEQHTHTLSHIRCTTTLHASLNLSSTDAQRTVASNHTDICGGDTAQTAITSISRPHTAVADCTFQHTAEHTACPPPTAMSFEANRSNSH